MKSNWIFDGVSVVNVIACEDPAEALARRAAMAGEVAREFLETAYRNSDPVFVVVAACEARIAWRFARAAILLDSTEDELRKLTEDLRLQKECADAYHFEAEQAAADLRVLRAWIDGQAGKGQP